MARDAQPKSRQVPSISWFRVQGLGFRVLGFGFRVVLVGFLGASWGVLWGVLGASRGLGFLGFGVSSLRFGGLGLSGFRLESSPYTNSP